jgi:hypothetical protein
MKQTLLLIFFCFIATFTWAQKYVLLDQHMADPIQYSNTITSADNFNDRFPVEKKLVPEFLKALEEIENKLSSNPPFGKIKDYQIGCIKFTGRAIMLATGERIDYVIISTCENVRISMHLSDAKMSNKTNAFFIKTWIQYIKGYGK